MKSFLVLFCFRFLKTSRFSFSFYKTKRNHFRFHFRFRNANRSAAEFPKTQKYVLANSQNSLGGAAKKLNICLRLAPAVSLEACVTYSQNQRHNASTYRNM